MLLVIAFATARTLTLWIIIKATGLPLAMEASYEYKNNEVEGQKSVSQEELDKLFILLFIILFPFCAPKVLENFLRSMTQVLLNKLKKSTKFSASTKKISSKINPVIFFFFF